MSNATQIIDDRSIDHIRGKLQQAFLDEAHLGYEALTYPVKNGKWVDPFCQSSGTYQVALKSITQNDGYNIRTIKEPREAWGKFTLALHDANVIDDDSQLTAKGRSILFHACYRDLLITVGEFTVTMEASYIIEGED